MFSINSSDSWWWKSKRFLFECLVCTSNALFGKELVHRSRLAGGLNRCWLALVEAFSPARRRQARFERNNPDAPWFVPDAIPYIEQRLRPDSVGFEWGCGRSTLWFARRVGRLTSVEGRPSWLTEVARQVDAAGLGDRVRLVLAEVTTEYAFVPAEVERYAGAIDSVADASLDFIVVDGHFREACLEHVGRKLRPGGMLVIDNSEVVSSTTLAALMTPDSRVWNNGIWETTLIALSPDN